MTKFRRPTPHTLPPTSKKGEPLRVPRNGLPWALCDVHGVVHVRYAPGDVDRIRMPACDPYANETLEDTLADVTCFWCIAGASR
jgi:hypothetical protein